METTAISYATPVDEAVRLQRLHQLCQSQFDQNRLARVAKLAAQHLRAKAAKVGLVHTHFTEVLAAWSESVPLAITHQVPRGTSTCAQAILSHKAHVVTSHDGKYAAACVPLLNEQGTALGALCVLDDAGRSFLPRELDTLEDYASLIEDELTRANAREHITQLKLRAEAAELRALTDSLTGLWNRQALNLWCQENHLQQCALLMVDIDRFKTINDLHGHVVGDTALQMVADALRAELRPQDFLARYGGDEFLVCLPNCDAPGAQTLGSRLRSAVATHKVQVDEHVKLKVSISVGVAQRNANMPLHEALAQADAALLAAKKGGKDRVMVAASPARQITQSV